MGLGISIFLIAVGAIGLLLSMAFWSRWGGFGGRRTTIVEDERGRVL